jgi:hypothetical protein
LQVYNFDNLVEGHDPDGKVKSSLCKATQQNDFFKVINFVCFIINKVREMTENKRKHTRVRSLNLLYVGVYEKDVLVKQGIGRTLDVSESGIRLETHFPIDPKNIVQLAIGLKDELVDIKGRAVHTVPGAAENIRSASGSTGLRNRRLRL